MKKRVKKPVSQSGGNQKIPEKPIAENRASGKECCSKRVVAADCCGISSAIGRNLAELSADKAETEEKRKFDAWRAKYEPIEREIYEKRRRRAESKRHRAIARRKAFGDLCEMTDGLAAFCRKNGVSLAEGEWMLDQFRRPGLYAAVFVTLFFDIVWFGAIFLRKELTKRIDRAKHEALRPYYYEQERARRQAMAEERRKISRRSTHNPCPTREEILDAWKKVENSNEDLLRFGSLMEDLECYIDNSLIRDDSGAIIGRRSGIKGWLQVEIPALYTVYSRVMAYKAAAKRMRQIIELHDPLPLSSVLDMGMAGDLEKKPSQDYSADEIKGWVVQDRTGGEKIDGKVGEKRFPAGGNERCITMGMAMDEMVEVTLLRARAIYLEVIKPVGEGARKQTALIERMTKLTDPDSIEDANMLNVWRQEYERKITVRTKSVWVGRLMKMMA